MRFYENLKYGEFAENVLDIYVADGDASPVFVYFHGGGIESGSQKDKDPSGLAKTLAKRGVTVVSATYRKYPSARFPQFIEDGAAVVAWAFKNIASYIKPEGVFVGGSSAGGYISQMLCFDKTYLGAHGIAPTDIAGFFHDAGQPTTHFNVLKERGINTSCTVVDDAAPMYHVDGSEKYPPMKFIVSDHDMLNRYEQTMLMMAVLRNFGYDMEKITCTVKENTTHCSYCHTTDDVGDFTLADDVMELIGRRK